MFGKQSLLDGVKQLLVSIKMGCASTVFFSPCGKSGILYLSIWLLVGEQSPDLRKVSLEVLPNDQCQHFFRVDSNLPNGITSSMICTLTPNKDTCLVSIESQQIYLGSIRSIDLVRSQTNKIGIHLLQQIICWLWVEVLCCNQFRRSESRL